MANYLKMPKIQQVIALLALGWSFRRIERETGVHRETVSKYAREGPPKPAKVFPGTEDGEGAVCGTSGGISEGGEPNPAKAFPGSRSAAKAYAEAIEEKLEKGLTVQRVWQDLVEEYGYGHSYESIKRYVRRLHRLASRPVGVMHSPAGEEVQVDFFHGAPTFHEGSGQWRRPWVFRMTLCHSRHGYEEAVWDQKQETFLRLHERAFRDFGGVPKIVRLDNQKPGVSRACLFDPDVNTVYVAFAKHWDFTPLPIRPRNPRENGKEERAGGYVKSNALKARRFDSLADHNAHLKHWNRTVARLRIHGTTRRQVWTHFQETDQKALQALPAQDFPIFSRGIRSVHPDSHVEVAQSFYPVPPRLIGKDVEVRWDEHLVRVFEGEALVAVRPRVAPGDYAPSPGQSSSEMASSTRSYLNALLGRCERLGAPLRQWGEAAFEERGVRALRLIQGVLSLTRKHPKEALLAAAKTALTHKLFRYKDLLRLTQNATPGPKEKALTQEHDLIRPLTQYRLEDFL